MIPVSAVPLSLKDIVLALFERDIENFKNAIRSLTDCDHVVLTDSGTSALLALLRAYGVRKGDRVGIPAYTCEKIVRVLLDYGCDVRLFDVDDSYNLSIENINRVDVIVAIHMFGNPCDVEGLSDYARLVLEDSAQCIGARFDRRPVGSLGDSAFFSFGKGKPITAMGGGALVTSDEKVAGRLSGFDGGTSRLLDSLLYWLITKRWLYGLIHKKIKSMRRERWDDLKNRFELKIKSMSGFQVGLGTVQIKKLEEFNDARRKNSTLLWKNFRNLEGLELPKVHPKAEPVFLRFPIRIVDLKLGYEVERALLSRGIETTRPYNYIPQFFKIHGEYPNAKRLVEETLTLPVHPGVGERDLNVMVETVRRFFE